MELSSAVRTGYYTALNGNITYNSKAIPVYDTFALPDGVPYPYILLSSQTSTQRGTKGCKVYDATILIDIVTGNLTKTGRFQAEQIAEQIDALAYNIAITVNGYKIGNTIRESDTDLGDKNGQYYIFRKLLRYGLLIDKL